MLKIKEYNFTSLESSVDINDIDTQIKNDLKKISKITNVKPFIESLKQVIDIESDFSFIKASVDDIEKLKVIDTSIKINNISTFNSKFKSLSKFLKPRNKYKNCTLNNILEFIFGYHIEDRTQLIKKYFKSVGLNNCVYCLAQYTTSYGYDNKIYIKGNLDHIYPKSLNALVSLSINNLVPVCGHCNQRKLNADLSKFNFNPFNSNLVPYFSFKKILEIDNGNVTISNMENLEIKNINPTLESRLQLSILYKEYSSSIENILDRHKKFNSTAYKDQIESLIDSGISSDLEYFISELPYTEENIQNVPLHKFKSDFYKELEEYKKNGKF